MKKLFTVVALGGLSLGLSAQSLTDPNITSWMFNTTGHTTGGVLTDVESLHYTPNDIWITASGIPSYYVAGTTVNDAADQNWIWMLPRLVTADTASPTAVSQGQLGIFIDGTPFFHPGDGNSYMSAGIWNQVAYKFEGAVDFDVAGGHSTPTNAYHHHSTNYALSSVPSTSHSPLIGFAFDGVPVYGPYGYTNPGDAGSAITRMKTSFQIRSISDRTTLPDGTVLTPSQYGPAIATTPLGYYIEDYEYVAGSGDLDIYNGRWCKTPEYPSGAYCYFTTIDASLDPEYPYFVGEYFYGTVSAINIGPTGGAAVIPGTASLYDPVYVADGFSFSFEVFPNPAVNSLRLRTDYNQPMQVQVSDLNGTTVLHQSATPGAGTVLDVSQLPDGIYLLRLLGEKGELLAASRVMKQAR